MCLRILRGLLPDQFCGSPPTVLDLQSHLGHAGVLQALCVLLAVQGVYMPVPLRVSVSKWDKPRKALISFRRRQQSMAPDPPAKSSRRIAQL